MAYDRFPAVDEAFKFAPEVRAALATDATLRNVVVPMTQTQRNNLTGSDLWDGRLIENTTTDRVNRYDAGTDTWKVLVETADLDSGLLIVQNQIDTHETRIDAHDTALSSLDTRLDAQEAYINARIRSTSAGVQDNGFGRKYLDTGFGGWRANPPHFEFSKLISGTYENDGIHMTGYASSSIVYIDRAGGLSNGDPILVTVVD